MEFRFKIFSFSKCLLACLHLLIGFTQGQESYIAVESYSGKIVLELDAEDEAEYVKKISNGVYFMGMRVSTLNAL